MNKKRIILKTLFLLLSVAVLCLPFVHTFEGLSPAGHRILGIFLMAIVLWVSEAIPLHATAVLIIFLEILLVSDKSLLPLPEDFTPPKYASFYHALAHPVLMLFLGGFFLASGAAKFNLDRNLARVLLKPFGTSPAKIMLGLMLITALFSMFMSNTATTATMMAVLLPVIATLPKEDRMRGGLSLCIPIAANVGGMGTPVGTPPNAIAVGALSQAGIQVSFVKWMIMIIPGMVILLAAAWLYLVFRYPCSRKEIVLNIDTQFDRSRNATIFYLIFVLTLVLWLTEPLHGVKSSIVGFLPVVLLLATGVFTAKDLQNVQWHVLWLVAGGIALGTGVAKCGLDGWLIGLVQWEAMGAKIIAGTLCAVALLMSTAISNSATANLLVPLGMTLALSGAVPMSPMIAAVFIAVGASLAMSLPISTPPNAIAYSTGSVTTRSMAESGILIGILGWIIFVFLSPFLWRALGYL